ncbi:N-acetylmuramoyl-L-alanine amidase [Pelotomaculum propionicicum]|uniref:N-acetylmuramoyl-L-alanine amidase AmiC n=1 Tax=Pelotomaculum propionicicum TaxID=258475 RepID=A0A4Y7RPF5_9FIRM|nr:N-acetylmuramoyl-L-alanine amidase [Pelotomaculum propionicicum]NLI13487.1 SH3 domain-containing protein [Peptococcaceae bacterium]TEB10619.1 N-acetylmuramoyl-L-alanine amidase AmiC [Pelotomaculum propionicicum]
MHVRYQSSFGLPVILAFALFLGFLLAFPQLVFADTAVVASDSVNIRTGPGTTYDIIAQASSGDRLTIVSQSGDWYCVNRPSGQNGWIAGWLVNVEQAAQAAAPQSSGQVAVVSGSSVNIRSGPDTSYGIIAQANLGDRLPVLDKSGDWYKVSLSSGASGWVAGWLVAVGTPVATAPTPVNTTPAAGSGSADSGKTAVVTGSVVNVRNGPGTTNAVVGQVTQGQSLPVLEQSGDWVRVKLPVGSTGWVAGWLVSVQSAPVTTPQTPTTPETPAGQTGGGASSGSSGNTSSQSAQALSLKVNNSGNKTSAVIEANAPIVYDSFSLNNPYRLVLDLKGIAIGNLPLSTSVNSKTVLQVRTGSFQKNPDVTRVVFDLSGGAQYVASLSSDKKTLTVETYIPDISNSYTGKVIAIDPGHGGPDPGAVGSMGTKEKDITVDIAKRLAKILEARGAKVILTRTDEKTETDLYQRTDKANKAKADVFVSIHINANNDRSLGGTSTYIYSGAGDPKQTARIQESNRLANYVQKELLKTLGLRDVGVRSANFAVLRTSNMPAILAELAFISNLPEERYMNTDNFKNGAAEAIARGIGLYFSERRNA